MKKKKKKRRKRKKMMMKKAYFNSQSWVGMGIRQQELEVAVHTASMGRRRDECMLTYLLNLRFPFHIFYDLLARE